MSSTTENESYNPLDVSWVTDEGVTKETVEWAKSFGQFLSSSQKKTKPMTTGQLRRFFGEVKRIDSNVLKNKNAIPMLKPILAYAVGRDKNNGGYNRTLIKEFEQEISKAIDAIRIDDDDHLKSDYKNFVKILESIVAYHKYYGGQENTN